MKQAYDYSGFSLRRLNEPRFSHVRLLAGWIVYFIFYFLTERLIPADRFHSVHCALDDLIPFCEWFLVFYCGWYVLLAGMLAWLFFRDVPRFRKLQIHIMILQAVSTLCYILWPSRQDLRPAVFPRENVLTALMGFIYAFDTPTGVLPSLHAAISLALASAGLRDPDLRPALRAALVFWVLMICVSVCFVKQHSALDVLAAVPVWLAGDFAVYGTKRRAARKPSGTGSSRA